MTKNQWRMLDILSRHNGDGTIEVEIDWGDYDFGDGEANEAKGWRTCRMVVAGLVRSLVKKGYATDDENGYGITEAGLALLEKRRTRVAKREP